MTAATLCWGHDFCLEYDDTVETQLQLGADAAVASVRLGRLLECTTMGSLNPQPCNKCSVSSKRRALETRHASEVGKV